MFTLHKTTELTKQILKWGVIGTLGITVFIFTIRMTVSVFNFFFPKGPKPPNYALGVLPKLRLPQNTIDPEITYNLDTISGNLPTFEPTIKVYKINKEEPSLLNLERARKKIRNLNIIDKDIKETEKKLNTTEYQWTDRQGFIRQITMDTTTFDFRIRSVFQTDPTILASKGLVDKDEAITNVKSLLNSMDVKNDDIDLDKIKTELLSIDNGILTPATSLSTAQVIRVNLYHKDLDKLPIYYPTPQASIMNFILTNGKQDVIVYGDFNHKNISNESGTYPLKTSEQAYDELLNGKSYIASYDGQKKHVNITNVSLGYFLGITDQDYLMPIYVFEGQDNFVAYIPALAQLAMPTGSK